MTYNTSYTPLSDRYSTVPYARCGKSGLMLPRVSLGLWHNFGSQSSFANAREMLLGAFDLGITYFDAANNYGYPYNGSAEETLGRVMKDDLRPYRDELIIATKAGYNMWPGPYGDWGSRKYLVSSLDQSLKRMKLDYVDIFYHHRPDPDTPLEETMQALCDIVRQGKALYVGVSNYSAEQTQKAYDMLSQMGVRMLVHQPRYNMLDRWIENGLTDVLMEKGIGAVAFSPLAQGILTGKYLNGIPADSRCAGDSVFLNEDRVNAQLEKVRQLNQIALARGESLTGLALNWVLENPAITSVIIGASKLSQIKENVDVISDHVPLSYEERQAIRTIIES